MDKLKAAWSLVGKTARKKREAGEVPQFLGTQGMLALMYDRIVEYNKLKKELTEEAFVAVIVDLAVNSLFAVASAMPDIDSDFEDIGEDIAGADQDDGPTDGDNEMPDEEEEPPEENDEEAATDPRWTASKPGQPLPTRQ